MAGKHRKIPPKRFTVRKIIAAFALLAIATLTLGGCGSPAIATPPALTGLAAT